MPFGKEYTEDNNSGLTSAINTKSAKYGAANPYTSNDTAKKIKSQINNFTNPQLQRKFINKAAAQMASNVDGVASKSELENAMKAQKKNLGLTDEQAEQDDHNIVRKALHSITKAAEFAPQKIGQGIDWAFDNTIGELVDGSKEWFDGDDLSTAVDIAGDLALTAAGPLGWGLMAGKNIARNAESIGDAIAGDDYLTGEDLSLTQRIGKIGTAGLDTALSLIPAGKVGKLGKGLTKDVFEQSAKETGDVIEQGLKRGLYEGNNFDNVLAEANKIPNTQSVPEASGAKPVPEASGAKPVPEASGAKPVPEASGTKPPTTNTKNNTTNPNPEKPSPSTGDDFIDPNPEKPSPSTENNITDLAPEEAERAEKKVSKITEAIKRNMNKLDSNAIDAEGKRLYTSDDEFLDAAIDKAGGSLDPKTQSKLEELMSERDELLQKKKESPIIRKGKSKTGSNKIDVEKDLKRNYQEMERLVGKNEMSLLEEAHPDTFKGGKSNILQSIENVVSPYGASLSRENGSGFAKQLGKDALGAGTYTLLSALENGANPLEDGELRGETLANLAFATALGRVRPKLPGKYKRGNKFIGNKEKRTLSEIAGQRMAKGSSKEKTASGISTGPAKKTSINGRTYDPYALAQQVVQRQLTTDALKRIGDTYKMYSSEGADSEELQKNLQNNIARVYSDYQGDDREAVKAAASDMSTLLSDYLSDDPTQQDTRSMSTGQYLETLMPELNDNAKKHGYANAQDFLNSLAAYQEIGE